ncbi:calcium-binding protein [Rhizobium sp.]
MLRVITADSIGSGTRYALGVGDSIYVKLGVTIASTDDRAIVGGAGINATINGSVVADASAIYAEGSSIFRVGALGEIIGDIYGISLGAGTNHLIENKGMISGGDTGININTDNSNTVYRSTIVNQGTISGIDGIKHNYYGAPGNLTLLNEGSIHGTAASYTSGEFTESSGVDIIRNRGEMVGYISLGGGNDVYRGANGSLEGNIFGGAGNDLIICGDNDDRINGGSGADRLKGGDGEDWFYFGSSPNGNQNVDRILDFNVKDDMLLFSTPTFNLTGVTDFTDLFVANKTGKAEDAGDRFIYQTTTGKLFFDADGKGGSAAQLVEILSKNLDLTADNFGLY